MTLQELAKMCIALHVYSKDTEDTIMRVARLFEERSGVNHLHEINTEALLRFKTNTLSKAKTITFNGYLRYLKLLGSFAEEEKLVPINPFKSQRAAPKSSPKPKLVDTKTFSEAIRHLKLNEEKYKPAWFWEAVIETLYYTGIRRRQLVSIRLKDIDHEKQLLRASIFGSKTRREWDIPIHPALAPTLNMVIKRSQKALGRALKPNDYIFVIRRFNKRYAPNRENPAQMKREQVTGFFKRLSTQIEGRIGAHRIRHTTATSLCNPINGHPDLFATQELLGHADLSTTRIYVQGNHHRMRVAINQLSEPNFQSSIDN